jgi:glycosyltransferase involved in cell wall biosynthesis
MEVQLPRISIVVATYNAADTLGRCLTSIEEQIFREWELIVVDGGSTDGTVAVIQSKVSHIAYWHSRPDSGIYDAWNQAIPHARGEYLCFLGADDAWADEHALARLFEAIGSHQFDLVTSRGCIREQASSSPRAFGSAWDFRRFGRRMLVCHPGLLHRRTLFDQYGLFDSSFRITGDLDFLLRLPESTRALHVDSVTVSVGSGGVSRNDVLRRLREQRLALARCPRFGPRRAWLAWFDKLWRYPVARVLGIPH